MATSTRKPKAEAPVAVRPRRKPRARQGVQWKKLTILITDEKGKDTALMDHVEIHDGEFNLWRDIQEITSNPAMAAAMAGAPAEVLAGLPGESVAYMDLGAEIVLTYKVRFHTVGTGIGEFKPRFGS